MRQLVLASTSVWRKKMLADAGVIVQGVAPGVHERSVEPDPALRATQLALRKALAVLERHPQAVVIGADQVVTDGVDIWGKPRDPVDHFAQLAAMRGRTHRLVTGFAVLTGSVQRTGHRVTQLTVRADLSDDELRAYVASGEGSGCAGGYAAEGRGAFLFERVDGDWNNVIGLPLYDVMTVLRELGWRYGTDSQEQ